MNKIKSSHEISYQINKTLNIEENAFFNTNLWKLINDQLYIVALWTGCIVSKVDSRITRLKNNPVEFWFRHLKCNLLKNQRVSVSELTSLLYNHHMSKYLKFYFQKKTINLEKNNKSCDVDNFYDEKEKWKKNKIFKRKKGIYFEAVSNFGLFSNNQTNFDSNPIQLDDF